VPLKYARSSFEPHDADAFLETRLGFGMRKPSEWRSSIIAHQRKGILGGVQDAETRTSSQDGAQRALAESDSQRAYGAAQRAD
jgi:hypothetical protein